MNRLNMTLNDRDRFVCSAAMAAVFVLLAGGANAQTSTVWSVSKSSSNLDCSRPPVGWVTTCQTIGSAVSAASPGDVIVVGPGYYNESVCITTDNLSILGAQAGNDARVDRTNPAKESIVDATGQGSGPGSGAAFYLGGWSAVIDGFTIQGGTTGNAASGIYIGNTFEQILNNIIQNNAVGILDINEGYILIENNLLLTNNKGTPGLWDVYWNSNTLPGPGFGIAGETNKGTSITENAFEGNLAAAMAFYEAESTEINNNTSKGDGSFFVCSNCWYTFFDHNQGQDFGAQGFLPVAYNNTNADGAIDLFWNNGILQINDNVLEGGKAANYNGISFSNADWYYTATSYEPPYDVCEYCQVSNNTITRFAGSGIVAEPYWSYGTLEYSFISRNDVENNGKDGIHIAYAPDNEYNSLFGNKAKDNAVFDCADDTTGSFTLGTYNTWFNNTGSLSSPTGLCRPPGGIMTPLERH